MEKPGRRAVEVALVPGLRAAGRRPGARAGLTAAAVAVAEVGRRREGGRGRFPASAALWAPVWLTERALCSWVALANRLRGGVRYSEGRILRAASPSRRP